MTDYPYQDNPVGTGILNTAGTSHPRHICPTCRNSFVQPFVCITCGAERLRDETIRSQGVQIELLKAALKRYGQHSEKCERLYGPCICGLDRALGRSV